MTLLDFILGLGELILVALAYYGFSALIKELRK